MQVIDEAALKTIMAGDQALLADLAVMFVQLLPDIEARIRVAVEERNAEAIESIAHQLRSRVSYFGATDLVQQIKSLESHGRERDLAGVDQQCDEIFRGIHQMIDELRRRTQLLLEVDEE